MTRRRFAVEEPEQLKALNEFVLTGSVANVATVWSATKRKSGATRWDGKIFVDFKCDKSPTAIVNYRHACIVRKCSNGRDNEEAVLRYNKALQWCRENLLLVKNSD